jgi:TetR/AcrR family transcriptional repressor of nem operon
MHGARMRRGGGGSYGRPRSKQRDDLVISAMGVFWRQGFGSTSMADLVKATGVSRGGIYADFGGKEDLFLSCLGAYREQYIEPALAADRRAKMGLAR